MIYKGFSARAVKPLTYINKEEYAKLLVAIYETWRSSIKSTLQEDIHQVRTACLFAPSKFVKFEKRRKKRKKETFAKKLPMLGLSFSFLGLPACPRRRESTAPTVCWRPPETISGWTEVQGEPKALPYTRVMHFWNRSKMHQETASCGSTPEMLPPQREAVIPAPFLLQEEISVLYYKDLGSGEGIQKQYHGTCTNFFRFNGAAQENLLVDWSPNERNQILTNVTRS